MRISDWSSDVCSSDLICSRVAARRRVESRAKASAKGWDLRMTQKNISDTKHWLRTARTITEALPFMRRYTGKTFVIKYGGHAMVDAELASLFASDRALLQQVGITPRPEERRVGKE